MKPDRRVVGLLLLLQAVATVFLWTLGAADIVSEGRFAVFLAVDLLAFAMIAYIYTRRKWGELLSRHWLLAGSLGLVVLLLASLVFP